MFVRGLASAWASLIQVPEPPANPVVANWLMELSATDPKEVLAAVVAAPDEQVVAAVVTLLARARDAVQDDMAAPVPPLDGEGELLRRIVRNGHGTGFPHGELSEAHAHFLVGLESHVHGRQSAHRAYRLAALAYRSRGQETLARLADVAGATTGRAVVDGESAAVKRSLDALSEREPALAATLAAALRPYLAVLTWIATMRSGGSIDDSGLGPVDAEAVALLRAAAVELSDRSQTALRLARLADHASGVSPAESTRAVLARTWLGHRRWADAAAVLEELRAVAPRDHDFVVAQASAYAELGRWDEGKALALAALGKPPTAKDLSLLETMFLIAYRHRDPDSERIRDMIVRIDPAKDPIAGMPGRAGTVEQQPLFAAFRDGELQVNEKLFDLPEDERPAHLTAAIVAGSPDGDEMLRELVANDPKLADHVLALLGWRRVTPAQAEAEEHFRAAEQHFAERHLDDAQREYEAALRLNPDHANATSFLGDVWYLRGSYHIAQAYFEESLAIEPNPLAHRFLGDAIRRGGHGNRRARAQYEAALRLDPGYRGARLALDELGPAEPAPAAADPGGGRPPLPTLPIAEGAQSVPAGADAGDVLANAAGGAGDRLRTVMIERDGPDSLVAVADDPDGFRQWLSSAGPQDIVRGLMTATTLGYFYHVKDRDVTSWRTWVIRQVALAEALPGTFGPAEDPLELGRDRHLSSALYSLAELREDERKLPEARILYERSLDLLVAAEAARRAAGLAGESEYDRLFSPISPRVSGLERLARVCRLLGDEQAATAHLDEAWRLRETRPTTDAEVDAFIASGNRLYERGSVDDGLGQLQHALYLAEDEDPDPFIPRTITSALNALGLAYQRLGLTRTPLALFQRARSLNERTSNAHRLSHDHRSIASILRVRPELGGTNGLRDARGHLEQALLYASVPSAGADELGWTTADGKCQRITAPDRAWETLIDLGALLQEQGDDESAAHFLTVATRIADLLRASLPDEQQRIRVQNQQIRAYAELTKVYVRLAGAAGPDAARYADAAWLTNESMRARTFLDVLGEAELTVPPEIPGDIVDRERELLARRAELRREGGQDLAFWERYREVSDELDVLWDTMRSTVPEAEGYVEVRQGTPADPVDLAGLLRDGSLRRGVLASLVRLDDGTLGLLALRGDHETPIVATRQVDVPRLEGFVRQNFGSTGRVRELAADMEDLFQYELRAVTDLLTSVSDPDDVLVVCPVGVLHHVPLGALRIGRSILLERNPLSVLPSASLLRALRSAAHHDPAASAAVLGDPTGDLAGARVEALAIAARFGVEATLGAAATVDAARAGMTQAGVLHVAAHARFDAGDPLASGVLLADGTLSAREILTVRAPALSLVALSACETGVSETDAGEELVGLSRALLFAGADALIVSLWKVPDEPTMAIMDAFYDGVRRRCPTVDAMRAAVLAARDKYGHDRMDRWAGFQLIGDWK